MSKEGALLRGESGSNTERFESRKGAMDGVGVVRPLVMGRGFRRTGVVVALLGVLSTIVKKGALTEVTECDYMKAT
jgi:hypothetical protein